MIPRLFLLFLSTLTALGCLAQMENIDSLSTEQKLLPDSLIYENLPATTIGRTVTGYSDTQAEYRLFRQSPLFTSERDSSTVVLPYVIFSPELATPYSWKGGYIFATGAINRYPGLMNIDSGTAGVYQQFGNLSLSVAGTINKYGYFRGVHTQYGINGNVSYQFSSNLSASVFGTYYFGAPPLMGGILPISPAMAGYYGVSTFGGYIDYQVSDNFGVQVGGQTVQQIGTNRYRWEPIVTPYVKVGKIEIGLPVGQIIHGLIRSNTESRYRH